ncbi:MAG: hypothetical protein QOG02_1347 [Gaiellales bacterium]|jgi:hypothetical protein|nr:hypothetical protein [Gaiellales bacterium]
MPIDLPLQLGEPVVHRGITIVPVFPRLSPTAAYLTLDEALDQGLLIGEINEHGSVPELLVRNPLGHSVLLYDGEELVGAKQNRILNVSVLVGAGVDSRIPVSCVEQGRWRRHSRTFTAAPHAANPDLRRRKALRLEHDSLALGLAQDEVWQAVGDQARRMGVHSPTGAASDTFAARHDDLEELRGAFPLEPGQSGALLALPGGGLCLDYVSRPEAYARLHRKLLQGYLLDGIESLDGAAVSGDRLSRFVRELAGAKAIEQPSIGLGDDLRLRIADTVGSGLLLDGELVQLSAYAG